MKIALIGYGKMGHLIEEIALQQGHTIIAILPSSEAVSSLKENLIQQVDICIDFSAPQAVLSNLQRLAPFKKNIVMGTTGWEEHLDEVKKLIHEHQIGFLFSPNFSVGVHLFKNIVEAAAQLMNEFEDYDVAGQELHHYQKKDSPSGTAKSLVSILLEKIQRKKNPLYDRVDRPIAPHELNFSSVRCGSIPGTHTIIFDSPADTLTITHQARNREGFARGALAAAEWLIGKKGIFTLEDMICSSKNISNTCHLPGNNYNET
ncbi:4-hydroxy-tetrahydrodipicolinate reductase [Neochlamydia sp. EPS4]|uniref:4-hydroxy-tetrahydrodipicolinate reductase n=1 Tax=Neochlamydia sp. EPS4 TaxID=1478175 RepID=UPI0005D120EB|nr:4-hydroxy-tetrahydrodipicolinate reductase [Neochlamydia sp. EPS4]